MFKRFICKIKRYSQYLKFVEYVKKTTTDPEKLKEKLNLLKLELKNRYRECDGLEPINIGPRPDNSDHTPK